MTYKDKNVIDRSSLYNERYQIEKKLIKTLDLLTIYLCRF